MDSQEGKVKEAMVYQDGRESLDYQEPQVYPDQVIQQLLELKGTRYSLRQLLPHLTFICLLGQATNCHLIICHCYIPNKCLL